MIKFASIKKKLKKSVAGWLFILPTVVGLCVFTLYPILQSIMYSFHKYDMITVFEFVGINNYLQIFRDPAVVKAFKNTLLFCVCNI